EAFVLAFNEVVAQGSTIASIPKMTQASAPAAPLATVAAPTSMRKAPSADAEAVRALMVGTTLTPTGKREGLFVEVTDNFGTTGWVSVETLN
ncbi:MAG: SH3 domain-containing protein, partial [Erythrobacter sp.]|nr:SH3 domain-containing protein [Erythrobacter sp.]